MAPQEQNDAFSVISRLVDSFETANPSENDDLAPDLFFLEPEREAFAREMGDLFWLPMPRAYAVFCYAYSALFGIPAFTREAVARQNDRFSLKRLPLTIRSTSGFILDGFGYNRRSERPRKEIYLPGQVIRSVHASHAGNGKMRIPNPAMAYFGYHLIRASEQLTEPSTRDNFDKHCQQHYDYVGEFFRTGGYPFPRERPLADDFSTQTDQMLAGSTYADYWHNITNAAGELGITLNLDHLADFLPKRTSELFRQTVK